MIPIVVTWTKYTATLHGRVLKLVPCENCSTEYVYMLEREGSGVGTTVYSLDEPGAEKHAQSAAEETLQEYLENDFDAIPCPECGHYQRYMFPKLLETRSLWGPALTLALLFVGCLDGVSALYWSIVYLRRPSEHAFGRLVLTGSILLGVIVIGFVTSLLRRRAMRRFNPNLGDAQARIARGRTRAVTRAEFEKTQQLPGSAC